MTKTLSQHISLCELCPLLTREGSAAQCPLGSRVQLFAMGNARVTGLSGNAAVLGSCECRISSISFTNGQYHEPLRALV